MQERGKLCTTLEFPEFIWWECPSLSLRSMVWDSGKRLWILSQLFNHEQDLDERVPSPCLGSQYEQTPEAGVSMTTPEAGRGQRGERLGWSGGYRRELRNEIGNTVGYGGHGCLPKGNGSPWKLRSFSDELSLESSFELKKEQRWRSKLKH